MNLTQNRHILFKKAVKEYRKHSARLMRKLGRRYGLVLATQQEVSLLIRSSTGKGISRLDRKWNYQFIGGICRFTNRRSGVIVEAILASPPLFDHIDEWHMESFIATSKGHEKLRELSLAQLGELCNTFNREQKVLEAAETDNKNIL